MKRKRDDREQDRSFEILVEETHKLLCVYTVIAKSEREAKEKACAGDYIEARIKEESGVLEINISVEHCSQQIPLPTINDMLGGIQESFPFLLQVDKHR